MKTIMILGFLLGLYMIWSNVLYFMVMGGLLMLICGVSFAILCTERKIEISNDLLNELMGEKE